MNDKKTYYGIDWLRTIALIGIIMMHMLANNSYEIEGFIFKKMIPSFTNFTYLFMIISAFGMCCGYFEKMIEGKINLTEFYKKRYLKILPFFSCLIILDLIVEFSRESLFEAIADASLLFGLFPNNISVIGVGWFLGVVFAFYLIFPFFCVIIATKKRAWISFAGSLIMNYICGSYFGLERTNIIYCLCFFVAGGLIYLYRKEIEKIRWFVAVPISILFICLYYLVGDGNIYLCLLLSISLLICSISLAEADEKKKGFNKALHFVSLISMEMYLSHMVIYRFVEKIHLNTIFGNGLGQYFFIVSIVIVGTAIFSFLMQKLLMWIEKKMGWTK